jgi:hypothetical protein
VTKNMHVDVANEVFQPVPPLGACDPDNIYQGCPDGYKCAFIAARQASFCSLVADLYDPECPAASRLDLNQVCGESRPLRLKEQPLLMPTSVSSGHRLWLNSPAMLACCVHCSHTYMIPLDPPAMLPPDSGHKVSEGRWHDTHIPCNMSFAALMAAPRDAATDTKCGM